VASLSRRQSERIAVQCREGQSVDEGTGVPVTMRSRSPPKIKSSGVSTSAGTKTEDSVSKKGKRFCVPAHYVD
jgi:hypothetical protein